MVAFTKLPNLQRLICRNDQNLLAQKEPQSTRPLGFINTNCKCNVCKASKFSNVVSPPSMPGYSVRLEETTTCWSGPSVIYHLTCNSGRPECQFAHYVGRATSNDPSKRPMGVRWSNHKGHFKNSINKCKMTNHLLAFHRGEDPQTFVQIQILESCSSEKSAKIRELFWQRRLFAFVPTGLCVREESLSTDD